MLATILKALGALLRMFATGFMGLFVFHKGEEAQQAKDTAADNSVLQAEAQAAVSAPKTTEETAARLRKGTF